MRHFVTKMGTELPFLNLRGKDYLQVAHRLVWFREEKPDWSIETEIVEHDEKQSVVVAYIKNAEGRVIAKAHKQQYAKDFASHLEKSEAGAVGRALAFLGYGTAHAQELEEDEDTPLNQLSDSPLSPAPKQVAGNGYRPTFGKYKGVDIKTVPMKDLNDYCDFLRRSAKEKNKELNGPVLEFVNEVTNLSIGKIPF